MMELKSLYGWIAVMVFLLIVRMHLNWVWFRPKMLQSYLRKQGLHGSNYKLYFGDLNELVMMTNEAISKPINLHDNITPRVLPFFHKSLIKYGKNFFTWMGPKPIWHIMDPVLIKEVLTKNYQFQKPRDGNPLIKLMGKGLIGYEGDQWAKRRKMVNPAFHVEKLKHMLPAFNLSCGEMITKWEGRVAEVGTCEVDVWPDLRTMTSDVISRTAFGSSYEEGRRIFQLQTEFNQLIIQATQSIYLQGMRFLPTQRNRTMKAINREVNASVRRIIDKRLKAMKAGEASKEDLLGILLESNYNEVQQHENSKFGMTIEEIIEECKLFYFAGQETTTSLLVWTMILLGHHQEWQARARDEVLEVIGSNEPSLDVLNHLKIVTMIVHEVLRLYTPLGVVTQMIHEETKIGKVTLPAGMHIQLHIMLMHHDPEIWGEDAKEFKPERFSEGVAKVTKGQVSYFPFSWGPRICLGQNFAMLEAKMALAMILQRFSFELSPSYSHAPHNRIILQPQHGAHLILRKL